MSTHRQSAPVALCRMTAGQLYDLCTAKVGDAQAGPLAEAKLRSIRGLVDHQEIAIPADEARALGAVVGLGIFTDGQSHLRRHFAVRTLVEQPKTLKVADLKVLCAQSTADLSDTLSGYLSELPPDAPVTIETSLHELLEQSVTKRQRREKKKA